MWILIKKKKAKMHGVFTVDIPLFTINFNSEMMIFFLKKLLKYCPFRGKMVFSFSQFII